MKRYALINNQIVENITISDEENYSHPDFEETVLLGENSLIEIGFKYTNSTFTETEKTPEELENIRNQKIFEVNMQRSSLLENSDIMMLRDNWEKLSQSQQDNWISYRQALRDITEQEGFPHNVTWPTKPN